MLAGERPLPDYKVIVVRGDEPTAAAAASSSRGGRPAGRCTRRGGGLARGRGQSAARGSRAALGRPRAVELGRGEALCARRSRATPIRRRPGRRSDLRQAEFTRWGREASSGRGEGGRLRRSRRRRGRDEAPVREGQFWSTASSPASNTARLWRVASTTCDRIRTLKRSSSRAALGRSAPGGRRGQPCRGPAA